MISFRPSVRRRTGILPRQSDGHKFGTGSRLILAILDLCCSLR